MDIKSKYEDDQGNLQNALVQSCVLDFLKSDACKNLNAMMNYSMIRQVFKTVDDCVKKQAPDFVFPDEYQVYLDPSREKDYVLPWNPAFQLPQYVAEFRTPPPSDGEEDDEDDAEEGSKPPESSKAD